MVHFEVDEKANKKQPITCHIVATYSDDIGGILQNISAQDYFCREKEFQNKYRGKIEIVLNKTLMPGVNPPPSKVKLISYSKATGLFIFAKYKIAGSFAQSVGISPLIVVKFLENTMTIGLPEKKTALSFLGQAAPDKENILSFLKQK